MRAKWLNKLKKVVAFVLFVGWTIDPLRAIVRLVLRRFLGAKLVKHERDFVLDNVQKHRTILWWGLVFDIFSFYGVSRTPEEGVSTMVMGLVATVMATGSAWFVVSFGGIPQKLILPAMTLTWWMFSAFRASLTAMFMAVGMVTDPAIWPVLAFIYMGTYVSCVQYDTTDGLKIGLDEAQLKHSLAALISFQRQGITVDVDDDAME